MIAILTGGTGGAKFVQGMTRAVDPSQITVIVNTGDDLEWWGLHVSPDIDSVSYSLGGVLSVERGWGFEGDTFECLARMRALGANAWFQLGDRDLATHLRRTQLLAEGKTLSQATGEITRSLGIGSKILPMADERVETRVITDRGELSFQEFFVRERWQVPVQGVWFSGAENARPAPGLIEILYAATSIFIAPSNPITSIGPILAVPGIRDALRQTPGNVVAISPIIGEKAVNGPAGELMKSAGLPVSCAGVAEAYKDFLDVLVMDDADRQRTGDVEAIGVHARVAPTMMYSDCEKLALARAAMAAAQQRSRKVAL